MNVFKYKYIFCKFNFICFLIIPSLSFGNVFTDKLLFIQALQGNAISIDFEGVAQSGGHANAVELMGDEFPGISLTAVANGGIPFVGIPDASVPGGNNVNFFANDFFPTSGKAVLALVRPNDNPEGILIIDFALPTLGVGAYFLDVEAGISSIEVFDGTNGNGNSLGKINLQNKGDDSQAFGGIIAKGIRSAVLVIGELGDGVALDDLTYTADTQLDSDSDGIPDAYEDQNGLDKNDPNDAQGDLDSDGVTNIDEYLAGTDPNNPDSDGDGFTDGVESIAGTDPLDANSFPVSLDSDSDGIPNVYEDQNGLDKNDPNDAQGDLDSDGLKNLDEYLAGTDPNNPDSDSDGVSDGNERIAGTDPLDPNSFPISLSGNVLNQAVYLDYYQPGRSVDGYKVYVERYQIFPSNTFEPFGTTTPPGVLEQSTRITVMETYFVNPSFPIPSFISLQNGEKYRFTIKAVINGVEGPTSNQFVVVPGVFAALPKPTHPIVFLHGFGGSGRGTFKDTLSFLHSTLGWKDGGHLVHAPQLLHTIEDVTLVKEDGTMGFDPQGDFFTVDFGNKYADDGGYGHQGDEVDSFLAHLKTKTLMSNDVGHRFPVSLVAHSNGGIAARSFLVDHPLARQDVAEFVTYGTPHQGADVDTVKKYVPYFTGLFGLSLTQALLFNLQGADETELKGCDANNNPILSDFLKDLNDLSNPDNLLPDHISYTSIIGNNATSILRLKDCHAGQWDGLVPTSSADLNTVGVTSRPVRTLETNKFHIGQGNDFSAILWALDPHPFNIKVLSPVDIEVIAPDGRSISRNFTSIPGATHIEVNDKIGHTTTHVLIPFSLAGDYEIKVTPKPGSLPTDTYTIEATSDGKTTVLVKDEMVQDIPDQPVMIMVPEYVSIDITPHSRRNKINPKSHRKIKVAILSTASFDATTVDPSSVKFGPNNAPAHKRTKIKDVNKDGYDDLVLRFRGRKTGIACGDISSSLTGETFDGLVITSSDSIKTVGCKKRRGEKTKKY